MKHTGSLARHNLQRRGTRVFATAFAALALSVGAAMAGPIRGDRSRVTAEGPVGTGRPIVLLSDEAKARGSTASACAAETFTYRNQDDGTGTFGICFNGCGGTDDQKFSYIATTNSGTNDLGDPLPNTNIGTFMADNARLAGSTRVSSFSIIVRRSGTDQTRPGDAHAKLALWNGDPLGEVSGTGLGPSSGVELASCSFTLPNSITFGQGQILKCDLCPPVDVGPPGDVWVVLTSDSCRLFWPWTFVPPDIGSDPVFVPESAPRAGDGIQGFMEMGWDLDAGQVNPGVCCNAGAPACDSVTPCEGDADFSRGRCSDGDADFNAGVFFADGVSVLCGPNAGEDNCANLWMNVMSPAETTITLQPVATTGIFPSTGNIGIVGNEIFYAAGGGKVVIEIKVGDWDPHDTGIRLKAYAADLDSSGYTSGLAGGLTPYLVDCTAGGAALCRNTFGGNCAFTGAPCSVAVPCASGTGTCQYGTLACQVPTDPHIAALFPGVRFCTAGYTGTTRPEWAFAGETALGDVDLRTLDYRWGFANSHSATDDADPWPGDKYGGTLVLDISPDAKGTFTIGLFDSSKFVDQNNFSVPLLGLVPAKVTIATGRCCYDVGPATQCTDGVFSDECDTLPGPRLFSPRATCADLGGSCGADCNANGVPDTVETVEQGAPDCDGNGIPDECEPDGDGDGIIDVCDPCPEDFVNDEDGDGVCAPQDLCPRDAGKVAPGVCGCGTPDDDTDGDTVLGCLDRCPGLDDRVDDNQSGLPDCLETVPTVSAWGVAILALVILIASRLVFRRRAPLVRRP